MAKKLAVHPDVHSLVEEVMTIGVRPAGEPGWAEDRHVASVEHHGRHRPAVFADQAGGRGRNCENSAPSAFHSLGSSCAWVTEGPLAIVGTAISITRRVIAMAKTASLKNYSRSELVPWLGERSYARFVSPITARQASTSPATSARHPPGWSAADDTPVAAAPRSGRAFARARAGSPRSG